MTDLGFDDLLSEAEIEALYRPVGEAVGLPGRIYGAAFYRLEQEKLFPRAWCAVGFASDVAGPGDAVPVELAGWPLMLVRGRDGTLRAFHNVCRHRAMRVLAEPCRGRNSFACPWHSWTYDLDGNLVGTPRLGGERTNTDPTFKAGRPGLKPVRVAEWCDLVFVNLDGRAPPFAEHIAPLGELVGDFDLSELTRGESWSLDYPANWKVAVEGAIEDYHIPFGHPQLVRGARAYNPGVAFAGNTYMATTSAREYPNKQEATAAIGLGGTLPRLPLARARDEERTHFIAVFPTGAMQTRANHVLFGLLLPDGPEKTRLIFNQYYVGDAATDPAHKAERDALVEDWKLVFEQDIPFVRHVHENNKLRDALGISTYFTPAWETGVQNFQQAVIELMRD